MLTNMESWIGVIKCMVLHGLGFGLVVSLDIYTMIRILGPDVMQSVLGISLLFRAVLFIIVAAVTGK